MNNIFHLVAEAPSIPWTIRLRDPASNIVGRSLSCDIVLHDPTVSRVHADIAVNHGIVTVVDLQSRNGTRVDWERLRHESRVRAGQRISFGSLAFRLVEERELSLSALGSTAQPRSDFNRRGGQALELGESGRLTDAQSRVFHYLLAGLPQKRIASSLHVSLNTVHTHVRAIYHVLSFHSRPELMAAYFRNRVPASR